MPHRGHGIVVGLWMTAGLLTLPLALSGCKQEADPPVGPSPTPSPTESIRSLPALTGSTITLSRGETIALDIGKYNQSIGDEWGVIDSTSASVVSTSMTHETEQKNAPPGSYSEYVLRVTAEQPGSTQMTLQYCYRDRMSATCDQGDKGPVDPIKITVRVR